MSQMYAQEVPAYQSLQALVSEVNERVMQVQPSLRAELAQQGGLSDLDVVQHGAVRVGTASEMRSVCRLLAVMGMHPVGYYDLGPAGVPVHSTAFRAIDPQAMREAPFRLFVSMLRPELIEELPLRERVAELLQAREGFSPRLLSLIEQAEASGGLDGPSADELVSLARAAFRWCGEATVSQEEYRTLHRSHPVLADIACFMRPHINHLTPRCLDIDAAQQAMREQAMQPKEFIEGPARHTPALLLRQTSFKARPEPVRFTDGPGKSNSAALR
jgi:uncharacterized glyoxalase superfamily metalloenzyme YdcJ